VHLVMSSQAEYMAQLKGAGTGSPCIYADEAWALLLATVVGWASCMHLARAGPGSTVSMRLESGLPGLGIIYCLERGFLGMDLG